MCFTRNTHNAGIMGEIFFSLHFDNNKRNIGYVILEWISLRSLHRFLISSEAQEIFKVWPIEERLEVLELYDINEDINAQ